ncbi:inositol-tetrakisphosphate 1-kinase 6 isoform X1 [Canna indica]|uniref:Inositol-tetrakisphosphate 1-kinase 6 n=1 Tax=Canna indica TaxID=4628 RepID=A0AAQ3L3J0_9LILI|nr:inositol-tetrakisphosphate 1-kinase 6 isoform X1 [Canna indica]
MGAVRGVLLDESVLLSDDVSGSPCLKPGVEGVLRRLRYSNLRIGFCHHVDVSVKKAMFLQNTARTYSFSCTLLNSPDASHLFNQLLLEWGIAGDSCFYVASQKPEAITYEIQNHNWATVCVGVDSSSTINKKILFINKLEELLITICSFSKKAMQNLSLVVIGYVMKPSREEDFAKRGAFPMYPTQNRLMFVPLTFEIPLESQLQKVDAVLHKATDEIINFNPLNSTQFSEGVVFSKGIQALERFIMDHPECCIIDPLNNIYPLLDRYKIQQVLLGLQDLYMKDHCRLRAPHFLKIGNFCEPNLRDQLSEANLSFPIIVKPQIACGVGDAHNMALVFKFEDFNDLCVPLPAILQEYVDHGSLIYKFYVLGNDVFHAVKKSMPNASFLKSSSENAGPGAIIFDSLKSLPVAKDDQFSGGRLTSNTQSLDVDLVNSAANWLKTKLDLTIFGFDVVIQEDSGDHVIVDLNYLPSFKEVPDADAIPAFWTAIKSAYEARKAS